MRFLLLICCGAAALATGCASGPEPVTLEGHPGCKTPDLPAQPTSSTSSAPQAAQDAPPLLARVWLCNNTHTVTLYPKAGHADIVDRGCQMRLAQVPAASGTRYENEAAVFWDKGSAATLQRKPGRQQACREIVLMSQIEDARIPVDDHVRRERHLAAIEGQWGPAPGRQQSDGSSIFVLGEAFGNVFVGVQPAFGYEGDPMRLLFESGFAPTHAFSVFLRPRSSADAIDAEGSPQTVPGAATARRLDIDPTVGRAWLSQDKDLICLTVVGNGGSGTNCGASSFVTANGIVLTVGGKTDDAQQLVVGAVPDGVGDVTLKGSEEITVPVRENGYASLAGDVSSQSSSKTTRR